MTITYQEKEQDVVEKLGVVSSGGEETTVKSPEEKALVRKIDLYLMPTIWLLYLLAVSQSSDDASILHSNLPIVHGQVKHRQRENRRHGGSSKSQ
jgi:hypothetical protein